MKFISNQKILQIVLVTLIFLLGATKQTHAYLDPGTGSFIFQLLAAGLLGGVFAIKTFWGNIKSFFYGIFNNKKRKINSASKKG